jgi:hypothetical protein
VAKRLRFGGRRSFGAAAILVIAGFFAGGSLVAKRTVVQAAAPDEQAEGSASERPAFEVASIKVNHSTDGPKRGRWMCWS